MTKKNWRLSTHMDRQPRQLSLHVLHGVDRDLCAAEVNVLQEAPVRKRPNSRVGDLGVPELNLLQKFAASERLDTLVSDLCTAVQANQGQVGARVGQRFNTRVSDLRVGQPNLGEEGARGRKRISTRVGDLLVVAVASALLLMIPCPFDQRLVVIGQCHRWVVGGLRHLR